MTKLIGKITLYEPLDSAKFAALAASGETILLEVERRYALADVPDTLTAVLPAQFEDGSIDYMAALQKTIDAASFVHEQDVVVYKAAYDAVAKEFDFSGSYIRDAINSAAGGTITAGTILLAVFTTPSLPRPVRTVITLPYGQPISAPDNAAMLAAGLELNLGGTGTVFSVKTQKHPFTVTFLQPADATANYAIDFEFTNQIITV